MEWISVEAQLPDEGQKVLVYGNDTVVPIAFVFVQVKSKVGDYTYWQSIQIGETYRAKDGAITHWMPLPDPPIYRGGIQ